MAEALRHGDARDREAAERYYLEACEISQELGLRPDQAHCQRGLAQLYVMLGRQQEADRAFRSAADLFSTLDMAAPEKPISGSAASLIVVAEPRGAQHVPSPDRSANPESNR
jgi:Flp pilus assembly protein TadD